MGSENRRLLTPDGRFSQTLRLYGSDSRKPHYDRKLISVSQVRVAALPITFPHLSALAAETIWPQLKDPTRQTSDMWQTIDRSPGRSATGVGDGESVWIVSRYFVVVPK